MLDSAWNDSVPWAESVVGRKLKSAIPKPIIVASGDAVQAGDVVRVIGRHVCNRVESVTAAGLCKLVGNNGILVPSSHCKIELRPRAPSVVCSKLL